jgi:hypothetical protein
MRLDTVLSGRAIVWLLIVRVFAQVMGRRPYDRGLWCVVDTAPTGVWTPASPRVHDVERVLGVAPSVAS